MEEQIRIQNESLLDKTKNAEVQNADLLEMNQMLNAGHLQGEGEEGAQNAGDLATQFQTAAQVLQEDTSRSKDSFEMSRVKAEVAKLLSMQKTASDEELLIQYRWMETVLEEKYLRPREGSSSYRERHRKVRDILTLVKNAKGGLKNKNVDPVKVVKTEHKLTKRLSEGICRTNKTVGQNTAALQRLLAAPVPMTEQSFATERRKILAAYDKLIGSYASITKSFCISDAAKKNRYDAERILLMLKREKKLYERAKFDEFAMSHYRTWEEDLVEVEEKAAAQVNRSALTEKNSVFIETDEKGIQKDAAVNLFAKLVGGTYLYLPSEKTEVTEEDGEKKMGLLAKKSDRYYSHKEAADLSKETGKNLMYSIQALQQMATIQIIDMICGQKNRRPDSFIYTLKESNIEEEDYLVIDTISVADNVNTFGTERTADLNVTRRDQADISTRQLIGNNGALNVSTYDEKVADNIMALNPDLMKNYFASAGLTQEQNDAFIERLQKVQEALQADLQYGSRKQVQNAPNQYQKDRAVQRFYDGDQHFIGYEGLLQDRGIMKGGDMDKLNSGSVNKKLGSNKKSSEKTKALKTSVEDDLQNKFGRDELGEDTEKILNLLQKYTGFTQDKEAYQGVWDKSLYQIALTYRPELIQEISNGLANNLTDIQKKQEVERILRERYISFDELMNRGEEEPLEELRPLLEDRIAKLEANAQRTPSEEQELIKLRDYNTKIFSECAGTLEVPNRTSVKYVSDRKGFDKASNWKKKDAAPLFSHEPRISDLNQGNAGDCYFVATLAAVVNKDPSFIKQSMHDNGDGTVTVRFFKPTLLGNIEPVYVKVDKSVPGTEEDHKSGLYGALWAKIYEKAFVASGIKTNRWFTRYNYKDIYAGVTEDALIWIAGKRAETIVDVNDNSKWYVRRNGKEELSERFYTHAENVRNKLQTASDNKQIILAGTFKNFKTHTAVKPGGEQLFRGMMSQHAYTVLGMENIGGKDYVRLRNPGGRQIVESVKNEITGKITYRENERKAGVFYLDIYTFARLFETVNAVS